jgi:hypothetical protein
MGGFNSGRRAMQPAAEHGLNLDLSRLLRQRTLVPGQHVAGSLTWTRQPSGERSADIGYEADMRDPDHAWLRLQYAQTRWDGTRTAHDYRVTLTTTVPPFGGVRWWFLCPRTARLATKLYLPPGAERFASRRAFRMAYESQRDKPLFRAQAREARVVRKLGAVYEHPDTPTPPRPKWMRHKTYDRLCAELEWWQAAQGLAFVADSKRFMSRWGRGA